MCYCPGPRKGSGGVASVPEHLFFMAKGDGYENVRGHRKLRNINILLFRRSLWNFLTYSLSDGKIPTELSKYILFSIVTTEKLFQKIISEISLLTAISSVVSVCYLTLVSPHIVCIPCTVVVVPYSSQNIFLNNGLQKFFISKSLVG